MEAIDTNCMTLTRFILAEQKKYAPAGTGDLTQLLSSIQSACKAVSTAVRRAGISNLFGAAGNTNVQVTEKILEIISSIDQVFVLYRVRKLRSWMYWQMTSLSI